MHPQLPNRKEMEEPLLKEIINQGGSIYFSNQGRRIEINMAKEFNLPDAIRDFTDLACNAKGHRIFRHHIQWVYEQLKDKGQMRSNSERNHWVVADAGYRRVGIQPNVKNAEIDFV